MEFPMELGFAHLAQLTVWPAQQQPQEWEMLVVVLWITLNVEQMD